MSLDDVIWRAVHKYPGGPKVLAARMELAHSTLQNMADPKQESHGWSLDRFRQLVAFSPLHDQLMQALCAEAGGMFVPLGDGLAGHSTEQLLQALQGFFAESGDVPRAIQKALARDGRVSDNELRDIERECLEAVQAVMVVVRRAREIHDQQVTLAPEQRP